MGAGVSLGRRRFRRAKHKVLLRQSTAAAAAAPDAGLTREGFAEAQRLKDEIEKLKRVGTTVRGGR